MKPIVYRAQAADGRGPWRPGWSRQWIDVDAPADRLVESLSDLLTIEQLRSLPPGMHYGCACRSLEALLAWFTPVERLRLKGFGYSPVRLNVDQVLAESPLQLVVGRVRPFMDGATRVNWR